MNNHRYINLRTEERSASASIALKWHREGDTIQVDTLNPSGSLHRSTNIQGAKKDTPDENRDRCQYIAEELEAYADGGYYKCPECGTEMLFPENVGEKFRCPCCKNTAPVDEYEQLSVYDFLSDVFDIEFRIGSDREYRSVRVMVACGGPNIYIDTATRSVNLYWWGDRADYPLLSNAVDALDAWAEELFLCY